MVARNRRPVGGFTETERPTTPHGSSGPTPPPPGPLGPRGRSPPFGATPASSQEMPPLAVFSRPPAAPHLPSSLLPRENRKKLPDPRARCEPLIRYSPTTPTTSDGTSKRRRFHPHRRRLPAIEHPPCQPEIAGFSALFHHPSLAKLNFRPAPATFPAVAPRLARAYLIPRPSKAVPPRWPVGSARGAWDRGGCRKPRRGPRR